MYVSAEGLLIILFVGLIAGWLAGKITHGAGFGVVNDILIGIVGAYIGNWCLPRTNTHRHQRRCRNHFGDSRRHLALTHNSTFRRGRPA